MKGKSKKEGGGGRSRRQEKKSRNWRLSSQIKTEKRISGKRNQSFQQFGFKKVLCGLREGACMYYIHTYIHGLLSI
jgi:hypothetical protein